MQQNNLYVAEFTENGHPLVMIYIYGESLAARINYKAGDTWPNCIGTLDLAELTDIGQASIAKCGSYTAERADFIRDHLGKLVPHLNFQDSSFASEPISH